MNKITDIFASKEHRKKIRTLNIAVSRAQKSLESIGLDDEEKESVETVLKVAYQRQYKLIVNGVDGSEVTETNEEVDLGLDEKKPAKVVKTTTKKTSKKK